MRFCPECGSRRGEGNRFCAMCGYDFKNDAEKNTAPSKAPGAGEAADPPQCGPVNSFAGMMGQGFAGLGMQPFSTQYPGTGRYFFYDTRGMMYLSGRTYKAWEEDGSIKVQIRRSGVSQENAPVLEADAAFFDRLDRIMAMAPLDKWDGFRGTAEGVYDGDSFSFTYRDSAGRVTSCGGYMSWPECFAAVSALFGREFEDLYHVHFPDLQYDYDRYMEKVIMEAGGCSGSGKFWFSLKTDCSDTASKTQVFTDGETGRRTIKFTKEFGHPILGTVVSTVFREPSPADPEKSIYRLRLSYHRIDENTAPACCFETVADEDLFETGHIHATAFTYENEAKSFFGYFAVKKLPEGDIANKCILLLTECTGNEIKPFAREEAELPRGDEGAASEKAAGVISALKACGMTKSAENIAVYPKLPWLSPYEFNGFFNIETSAREKAEAVSARLSSYG